MPLFLAMMFCAAAIAGGIVTSYAIAPDVLMSSGVLTFGRVVMYTITSVYAVRIAGVFMISLGTIWLRTRVMPRAFVFVTYALAVVLLVSINASSWVILAFPAWVLAISIWSANPPFLLLIGARQNNAVLLPFAYTNRGGQK